VNEDGTIIFDGAFKFSNPADDPDPKNRDGERVAWEKQADQGISQVVGIDASHDLSFLDWEEHDLVF